MVKYNDLGVADPLAKAWRSRASGGRVDVALGAIVSMSACCSSFSRAAADFLRMARDGCCAWAAKISPTAESVITTIITGAFVALWH